jgi:hypothetical protein
MDRFTITLKVLRDILEKKHEALQGILSICKNEETDRQDGEKQRLIDVVIECDEVFQNYWDKVKHDAEEGKEKGRGEIVALQALISRVMELDIAIRAQELKNVNAKKPGSEEKRPITAAYRNRVLDELNKHKMK